MKRSFELTKADGFISQSGGLIKQDKVNEGNNDETNLNHEDFVDMMMNYLDMDEDLYSEKHSSSK